MLKITRWLKLVLAFWPLSPLWAEVPPTPRVSSTPTRGGRMAPTPTPTARAQTNRTWNRFASGLNPEFGAALPPAEYYRRLNRRLEVDWGIPRRKATKGEKIGAAVGMGLGAACAGVAAIQGIQAVMDHAKKK